MSDCFKCQTPIHGAHALMQYGRHSLRVHATCPVQCPFGADHHVMPKDGVPATEAFRYTCRDCWAEWDLPAPLTEEHTP